MSQLDAVQHKLVEHDALLASTKDELLKEVEAEKRDHKFIQQQLTDTKQQLSDFRKLFERFIAKPDSFRDTAEYKGQQVCPNTALFWRPSRAICPYRTEGRHVA